MPDLLVNADPARAGFLLQHGPVAFRAGEAMPPRPAWQPRQPRSRRSLPPVTRPAHSRLSGNHLPHSVGWLASLLFHGTLLVLCASLLVRSARLDVISGKTSTEMILMAPPAAIVVHRTAPIHATTPPLTSPLAQPVLPPVAVPTIQPALQPAPIPLITSTSSSVAKHHPQVPVFQAAANSPRRGAVEAQPDELNNQPPVYPEDSRAAREEGVVMLRADVSAMGEARHVAILKSSGYFRLDQAAREAVRAWRFHPALLGDIPISSEVDVPVRFELH